MRIQSTSIQVPFKEVPIGGVYKHEYSLWCKINEKEGKILVETKGCARGDYFSNGDDLVTAVYLWL